MPLRPSPLLLCGLLFACQPGCATTPSSAEVAAPATSSAGLFQTTLSPGGYDAAFTAARDVLRENRFLLERVDAAAGVLTTQRSTSKRDPLDVIQRRARVVFVSFAPAATGPSATGPSTAAGSEIADPATAAPPSGSAPPQADLRDNTGTLALTVRVIIERIEVPGWQIPPSSVRLATRTSDPEKAAADLEPLYTVPVGEDTELAQKLLSQIQSRLAAGDLLPKS